MHLPINIFHNMWTLKNDPSYRTHVLEWQMTRLGAMMENENTRVMFRLDYLYSSNTIGDGSRNPLKRKKKLH